MRLLVPLRTSARFLRGALLITGLPASLVGQQNVAMCERPPATITCEANQNAFCRGNGVAVGECKSVPANLNNDELGPLCQHE